MLNLQKRNKGFTIIEVMIVLAIAGLIMLIVFLAVPALQRSSRNTQAKNAAGSILATVDEYVNNNNGLMPTSVTIVNGTVTASGTGQPSTGQVQGGYSGGSSTGFPSAGGTTGVYAVGLGQKCNGSTGFTASGRSVAVGYLVETASTTIQQCNEG